FSTILISILALAPSQPLTVWLTYQEVKLSAPVCGVGATVLPNPPVDDLYHLRFCPPASSAVASSPLQYTTGDSTNGGGGGVATVIVNGALGPSHPVTVWDTYQV